MNESKSNSNSNEPTLSNDPIFVNDEIERLHRKIFHLRRTNNEIRKFYSDDSDCVEALHENVVIIERTLKPLFIYFELYHELTQKHHFYTKLYESDLKIKDKLNKHSTYSMQQKPKKLDEFDLDYVAQRLKDKSKEIQTKKKKKQRNTTRLKYIHTNQTRLPGYGCKNG
eukprot:699122_1